MSSDVPLGVPSLSSSSPSLAPSTPHLNPHGLLIAVRDPSKGRGVYASRPLPRGTLVDVSPVLVFERDEYDKYAKHTIVDHYSFVWKDGSAKGRMALALGLGSMFNHSAHPNVSYTLSTSTSSIHFTLVRDVEKDEELCISYGSNLWFEEAGLSPDELARRVAFTKENAEGEDGGLGRIGLVEDISDGPVEAQTSSSVADSSGKPLPTSSSPTGKAPARENGSLPIVAPSSPLPSSSRLPSKSTWVGAADLPVVGVGHRPENAPLETIEAWVVDVNPRLTKELMSFLRNSGINMSSIRHLKQFNRRVLPDDSIKLSMLICEKPYISEDELKSLLHEHLPSGESTEAACTTEPYTVAVPSTSARTRGQLIEWTKLWPVMLHKPAGVDMGVQQRAKKLKGSVRHLMSGSEQEADCASEELEEYEEVEEGSWERARVDWVIDGLRAAVAQAKKAKAKGELPIGMFVTAKYGTSSSGPGFPSSLSSATPLPLGSGAPSRGSTPTGSRPSSPAPTVKPPPTPIKAYAHDTRRSERNPIRHGLLNVVREVARIRVESFTSAVAAAAAAAAAVSTTSSPSCAAAEGTKASAEEMLAAVRQATDKHGRTRAGVYATVEDRLLTPSASALNSPVVFSPPASSSPSPAPSSTAPTPILAPASKVRSSGSAALTSSSPAATAFNKATTIGTAGENANDADAGTDGTGAVSNKSVTGPSTPGSLKNGQDYLLKSLTLFATHEPCMMCSMALVHSRVASVYYVFPSPRAGGCGSVHNVHEKKGLNHHFAAYRWRGDPELLGLSKEEVESEEWRVEMFEA